MKNSFVIPQIIPAKRKKYYSLSSSQERYWVFYKINPNSPFCNCVDIQKIIGNLDITVMKRAIKHLVLRHEALRTNFKEIKGNPVQIIHKNLNIKLGVIYLSQTKNDLDKTIEKHIHQPFNLEEGPLLKVKLIKLGKKECIFVLIIHHIIFDYWSMEIFYRELFKLYDSFKKNKKPSLSDLTIQYKDYAEWEKNRKKTKEIKIQEKYWLKKLSGDVPVLNLPLDKFRPAVQTFGGGTESMELGKIFSERINRFIKENNTTLFNFIFSVFIIFLYKITNQTDIIIGVPSTSRNCLELENIIGVFVNNLPIRIRIDGDKEFISVLNTLWLDIIEASYNRECSLEDIIKKIGKSRNNQFSSLFNVMCQEYSWSENKQLKWGKKDLKTIQVDLRFFVFNKSNQIIFNLNYNSDLFYPSTIKRWLEHILTLTQDILENPQKKISQLELISEKEKKELLYRDNSKPNYPRTKTIHQLFEEQVQKTPYRIAIDCEDQKLTYQELNQKANQLAHYLIKQKIKKEEIIPIILDNSPELVISMLAVLKAGGAFVLIDKETPKARIEKIIQETKAKIVLSQSTFLEKATEISRQKKTNSQLNIHPHNLATILYTSSTTGKPKGVMLEHKNIVKYACQLGIDLKIKPTDNLAQNSSVSYAITLWHIFTPLFFGAKLFIYPMEISRNPFQLFPKVKENKIRLLETTPSFLNVFLDSTNKAELNNLNFKELVLTGETIPQNLIRKLKQIKKNLKIFSHYGQAEIQTPTRLYEIKEDNKVLIGKPENGSQIYILDENQNLVPKGILGMMYASGQDLLFRGYLNDPQKTKKVIQPHPFIQGELIYQTGDLGKMHSDGNIEYLGRADQQVKIRGNRVEPEEVENCLNRHPDIKQSVVLAKKDQNEENYLVAYYTAKKSITEEELRDYLKDILPAFMIPGYFMKIDSFSLNQNGKLDRLTLPEPDREARTKKYQPPRTELEKKLVEIWQEVLNVKNIGINDNFFELGGHSLKAVQLAAKMKRYEFDIPLSKIFKYSQIAELARYIERNDKKTNESSIIGGVPLTAIYDCLSVNRKSYFKKNRARFEIRILDSDILIKTYLYLSQLHSDIHFYALLTNEKNDWKEIGNFSEMDLKRIIASDLKEIKIKKSDKKFNKYSIFFKVSFVDRMYNLFFQTKSVDFDKTKFTDILKDFQIIYNRLLLGNSQKEIAGYFFGKKKNSVPMYSYPEYYDCAYATISEAIRQKNDKKIFKSLIPGFNLESLPSYCITNGLVRKNSNINTEHLGRKKFFDILGIKHSVKILKNSEEAMRFYKKHARENNPIILVGTAYHLPFAEKSYQSRQFIKNCIKGKRVPSNWSVFYGLSGDYSIIYSPNIGFFGKISLKDFMQYWRGTESIPELSGVKLEEEIPAYQVINIENISSIKEHPSDMLREALKINVIEFFNSKIIKSEKNKKRQETFLGKKAILIFKKDIEDSIKNRKKKIPDIFIIDMFKKMEMAHLFLRDIILDLCLENKLFISELKMCEDIIKIWEELFRIAEGIIKRKNIQYRYNVYLPPSPSLWNVDLFSKQEKQEMIQSIANISNVENRLFHSLRIKLKNK